MRRPNMTLALLWEEYRGGAGGLDGFGYSWFCDLYREWAKRLKEWETGLSAPASKLLVKAPPKKK